jgi:mannose-6-phosphate isomerase-like protein (cupin superfamily)
MPASGRTWTNPRTGAWLTWLPRNGDAVIERVMKPHTGKADAHYHLDFDERFEVVAGTATIELEGRPVTVAAGETMEIPRRTPHRNAFNATEADLRLRHTVSPGGEFAAAFVSALGHYMETDSLDSQDEFRTLQLLVVLHETRAQSYLARPPVALQKPVIAAGALLGRLRGYRAGFD